MTQAASGAPRGPQVSDLTATLEVVKLCSNDDKIFYINTDVAS